MTQQKSIKLKRKNTLWNQKQFFKKINKSTHSFKKRNTAQLLFWDQWASPREGNQNEQQQNALHALKNQPMKGHRGHDPGLNTVKMSIFLLHTIPIKIQVGFLFVAIDKLILKSIRQITGTTEAKTILKRRKNDRGITPLILRLNHKSEVLAKRWIHKSVEQNKKFRNKPIERRSFNFWRKCKGCSMDSEQSSQQTALEQLHTHPNIKQWTPT